MLEQLIQMDGAVLLWIQSNLRNDILTPIFIFITTLGNVGLIWIAVTLFLLIIQKTRRIGCLSAASLTLSFIVNNLLLKNIVHRTRPYEVVQGLTSLIGAQSDYSFPSGHTGASFSVAMILLLCLPKRYGIPAMILAVLISVSRLYLGVHYVSDVLCGAIIGGGIALLVWKISQRTKNRDTFKL